MEKYKVTLKSGKTVKVKRRELTGDELETEWLLTVNSDREKLIGTNSGHTILSSEIAMIERI